MAMPKTPHLTFDDYRYYTLHYLGLIWRWKFVVVPVFAIVTAAVFWALVALLSLVPVKSTSVLLGIENSNKMSAVADVGDVGMNKYELIKSRRFLETIVEGLSLQLRLKKYPRKAIFQNVTVDSTALQGAYHLIISNKKSTYTILLTNKKKGYKNFVLDKGELAMLNLCRIKGVDLSFAEDYLKKPHSLRFSISDNRIAVDHILENLRVSTVEGSNFLVTMSGTDYELITITVNRIADLFVESTLNFRKRRTQTIFDVLQKQLDQAQQELQISKEAFRSFMAANPSVRLNSSREQATVNDLSRMENRSVSNDNSLRMANNLLQRYTNSSPEEQPPVVREILAYLATQQYPGAEVLTEAWVRLLGQEEVIEGRYSSEHPFRKRYYEEIEAKEKRIIQALSETLQTISSSSENQKKGIDALNEQLRSIPTKELRLAELERKYGIDNQLYSDILSQYNAAKISNAVEMADVYVMDYAVVPLYTNQWLQLIQLLCGAMIAGLLVSIAPLVLKNIVDDQVRTTEDARRKLKSPILATVPVFALSVAKQDQKIGEKNSYSETLQMLSSTPLFISEIFRSLRTNLVLQMSATESKVLAVTSYSAGDGKSMLATNIAIMCARNGIKTVLVDLDLRCGVLDKIFGVPESPGFSDIFLKKNSSDQSEQFMHSVRQTEIPDLSILTSGVKPPNPQELLGSRVTPHIIAALRSRFDLVIVDCAPIGLTSDAAVISEIVDKFIVVVRANNTKIGRLQYKISEFATLEKKLMGYVLNRAVEDVIIRSYKQANRYNYGYGSNSPHKHT